MTLLDSLDIYFGSSKRTLELYQGDLTNLSAADAVDFLVVSALPGDYTPVSGSLINSLAQKGVSVQNLSQNKAADYEPTIPCWVSQPVSSTDPGIQFKRILLYEPDNPAADSVSMVKDIFEGLSCFQGGSTDTTAAMPLVSTGSGGASDTTILTALFFAAAHGQAQSFPLNTVKIAVYDSSRVAPLSSVFATLKSNYENLFTLSNLPGNYSSYASYVLSRVKSLTLPSYLTLRQAFGICLYTSNYYSTINSVLRSQQWSDPNYQSLLPVFESIDSGLANIPPFTGMAYRGESSMSASRLAEYTPGNKITELGYTSTAFAPGSWYNTRYQFNIQSILGSKINAYSMYPSENEVLFHRWLIELVNTKTANAYSGFLFGIDEVVNNPCS